MKKNSEICLKGYDIRSAERLFESTQDPIVIYIDDIIATVNKSCIDFFDAKNETEIVGHSLTKFLHPEYKEHITKRIQKITQQNEIAELSEEKIITLKNIAKDVEMIGVPIIYGGKIGSQIFFRDITKRIQHQNALKKSEKELKRLNATKDKFFAIIAHDLRNPFNQLLSFTELIYENIYEYSFEELKEYIGLLNKSAKNGFSLLENLLEWARSQSGKKEFNPQNFDIKTLIKKNINILKPTADNKKIEIISELTENLNTYSDYNMINTVLSNLISNAIKFTNINGKITLNAIEKENNIQILIKDNGVGLSEKDINKLFKIDIHHSTKGTNNESGTGLGLILCYEFIKLNNGKIWVESKVSEGSTFYFTLPK